MGGISGITSSLRAYSEVSAPMPGEEKPEFAASLKTPGQQQD
jgi:hypothetical protein